MVEGQSLDSRVFRAGTSGPLSDSSTSTDCQGQVLDKGCAPPKVHVLYCQMQLANKLGYVRSYYIHCPSECCVGTLEQLEILNLVFLVPIAFDGLILS